MTGLGGILISKGNGHSMSLYVCTKIDLIHTRRDQLQVMKMLVLSVTNEAYCKAYNK